MGSTKRNKELSVCGIIASSNVLRTVTLKLTGEKLTQSPSKRAQGRRNKELNAYVNIASSVITTYNITATPNRDRHLHSLSC